MNHESSNQSSVNELDRVIAAYLQAEEKEGPQNRQAWLSRHPELAPKLSEFFRDQDCMNGAVAPNPKAAPRPKSASTVDYIPTAEPMLNDRDLRLRPARAPRQEVEIGRVLAGQYHIRDMKAGGMGRVYFADLQDQELLVKVAIKTVADYDEWRQIRIAKGARPDRTLYESTLARFRTEAETWVQLGQHVNILWAWHVFDLGGKPYLVLEYAEDGDLATWIREGRLTIPLAINFAIQFCQGMLHAVRTRGIVHRDIKPANVLVRSERVIKIADFGLAKAFDLPSTEFGSTPTGHSQSLSMAGGGTLPYMAPEQFQSLSLADTRSDIFSFGAMLYEMLTGQRLFQARDPLKHLALRDQEIPKAHEIVRGVPRELSPIIQRCVEYEPDKRFASFADVQSALCAVHERWDTHLSLPDDPGMLPEDVQAVSETYSLVALGEYEKAIQCADLALRSTPNNPDVLLNKGNALHYLNRFNEAVQCLHRSAAIRPDFALTWCNLSSALLQLGDRLKALQAARRALRLDDKLADSWRAYGKCLETANEFEKAVRAYFRATKCKQHDWRAHLALGSCLLRCQKYAEALSALQEASEINPGVKDTWYYLALCFDEMDCGGEAIRSVDRLLQIDEACSLGWTLRGMLIWKWQSNGSTARDCLKRAIQLDPHNMKAVDVMSRIRET